MAPAQLPNTPMLHTSARSFLPASRVTIGGDAGDKFSNQAATIVRPVQDRWEVILSHPRFGGKRLLVRDHLLTFEGFFAQHVSMDVPPHLRIASAGAAGNALFAQAAAAAGDILLDEAPFMVVRRSVAGLRTVYSTGVSAFKTYFAASQERGAAAAAFNCLGGGEALIEGLLPDSGKVFDAFLRTLPLEQQSASLELYEAQRRRIATVLALWQANGYAFPLRGEEQQLAALYNLTMKMLHSCEPNCKGHVVLESGRIEVTALRSIRCGELLTQDYTGGEAVATRSVVERRTLLRRRGFECVCCRCERESLPAGAALCDGCAGPLCTAWDFEERGQNHNHRKIDPSRLVARSTACSRCLQLPPS